MARRSGVAGYPGNGTRRCPAVHALDAAVLLRLALQLASAGTAWHAVADEGDAVRDIATVFGRRLGVPVQEAPQETFGPLGPIFATDQPSSSTYTREVLGWMPTHPTLLQDLENIQPLQRPLTPDHNSARFCVDGAEFDSQRGSRGLVSERRPCTRGSSCRQECFVERTWRLPSQSRSQFDHFNSSHGRALSNLTEPWSSGDGPPDPSRGFAVLRPPPARSPDGR
jgi:hypothetical protein